MLVEGKLIAGEGSHQIVLAVPSSSKTSQAYIIPPSESKLSTIPADKPLFYSQFDLTQAKIACYSINL